MLRAPLAGTACIHDYKDLDTNSSHFSGFEHFLSNFPPSLAIFAIFSLHLESFMLQLEKVAACIFAYWLYCNKKFDVVIG